MATSALMAQTKIAMRVTAEQFNWRLENRITGAYEIKAPRTFRRGQMAPHCEQCGRETEFLFDGLIDPLAEDESGRFKLTKKQLRTRYKPGGELIPGRVCQRCRPLSD